LVIDPFSQVRDMPASTFAPLDLVPDGRAPP
jgi:hypothetical protein